MRMRINICGTGAMACLFGGHLAGIADVTLIGTWKEGLTAVRKQGIRVEGASGILVARSRAVELGTDVEPADLVLVLVKTWQTGTIAHHLPSLLKSSGVAVTFQNGIGNVSLLGPRAKPGTTGEGATLIGPGHVREGGHGPTHAAAPTWVIDVLKCAGFEARQCEPAEAEGLLWGKLVANCAINALSALLGVPNGDLLASSETAELMKRAACECAAVARRKGIVLPFSDPVAHAYEVARRTSTNRSSMLQDLQRGAPTECDAINGAVVNEGMGLGVPVPVNWTLWQLMRAAASLSFQNLDLSHANHCRPG